MLRGLITRPSLGRATWAAGIDRLRPCEKSALGRSKRVVLPMMIALSMAATLLTPLFSVAPVQAATVGTAGLFVPVQGRLVDSRVGTGIAKAPLAPMTPRTVQVTGAAGIPTDGVSAVLVTVTAVAPTTAGQMSAGPADGTMAGVMRYDASPYTSNSAVVMVSDAGQINIQATTSTNVMVDVQGYYTIGNGVTAAGGYSPVTQSRIVDTVNGVGLAKAKLAGGSTSTIQVTGKAGVPAGAAAVFVNFQINNSTTVAGYINPYATNATSRPGVSLNFDASPSTSIGAIVPLAADGTIKMYLSAGNTIDLLLDVEGYFTPGDTSSSAGVFTPAVAKIYDTRSAVHVAPGATVTIPIGGTNDIPTVANGLSAITANLTVIDTGTAGGYARAYASGTTEPTNVGTLTFSPATAGKYTTNLATIAVGADNAIKIHNVSTDTVDYIIDMQGWYSISPPTEFSVVGGDFVVGETYTNSQLISKGVDVDKVTAYENDGGTLLNSEPATALSLNSTIPMALDGTSLDGTNPIEPLAGATALDNTILNTPETEAEYASALAGSTGGVQYSTVTTWLDNAKRTVWLRYGWTTTNKGGGFGLNKIVLWHNINANVAREVTKHPRHKKYISGQKYNYDAIVYRHICTGKGWFRTCKTIDFVTVIVSVDFRTDPKNFKGTFGVVTAYCVGYTPRCPDWVRRVANY